MIIALDYDRTYKLEPELFLNIVRLFVEAGHTVYAITTGTYQESLGIDQRLRKLAKSVLATNHQSKFEFVKRMDIWIDIWINDDPAAIFDHYLSTLEPPVLRLRPPPAPRESSQTGDIPKRRRTDRDIELHAKGND